MQCLAWDPSDANRLACGQASGRVVITNFSFAGRLFNFDRVFAPKNGRCCNAVAWNSLRPNLLAAGFDRSRNEAAVLVWDVNAHKAAAVPPSNRLGKNSKRRDTIETAKPLHEYGLSEAVAALTWLPTQADCFAVGTGSRYLRVIDLREAQPVGQVAAHAKAVHGVLFNPFSEHQLATYSDDGLIKVWDLRRLDNAMISIQTSTNQKHDKKIQQITWCAARAHLLASIAKDDHKVKIWDVQSGELNGSVLKPYKTRTMGEPLAAISWVPQSDSKMLCIAQSGTIELLSLNETIPIAFSPLSEVAFAIGTTVFCAQRSDRSHKHNIVAAMRQLAIAGYTASISDNVTLFSRLKTEPELLQLWLWLALRCGAEPRARNAVAPFVGLLEILLRSRASSTPAQPAVERFEIISGVKIYQSETRSECLRSCGWAAPGQDLESICAALEADGEFERAACIAALHVDLRRALTALMNAVRANRENSTTLRLLATLLSGWSEGKSQDSLWKEAASTLLAETEHPYLRTMIEFLCEGKDFAAVLNRSNMQLKDKAALACRQLGEADLERYLERLKESAVAQGELDGLLLSGLGNEAAIELLAQYVSRTGDVQSGALLVSHVFPRLVQDRRCGVWIELYCEFLDRWQLWKERAHFDSQRLALSEQKPAKQIFARCNFCNSSLSMQMIQPAKLFRGFGRLAMKSKTEAPFQKTQISSCPNCSKPLPRCAICLRSFDVGIPAMVAPHGAQPSEGVLSGTLAFGDWYTWCQTCRHGGHSQHMADWFSTHRQCPVSDCECECTSLD